MSLQSHLDVLKGRHATLEAQIATELNRPARDSGSVARMKLEKLRLKEEMERLKAQ